jgi:hypothetical protein
MEDKEGIRKGNNTILWPEVIVVATTIIMILPIIEA